MELYIKFLGTLAFGLIGVGMVLKVLLEGLFNEWDAFGDIANRIRMASAGKKHVEFIRVEDILLEAETRNVPVFNTRLIDQRRKQINELDAVESRVNRSYRSRVAHAEPEIIPS